MSKEIKKESAPIEGVSPLTQFYDDLKAGIAKEHHHHHGGMMHHVGGPGDMFNPGATVWRNKAAKEAECLKDKCYKHFLVDIYCKISPLDADYVDGHHGQMCGDVDSMLAGKDMTATQYLTSCYEATHAPFIAWLLRAGENAAKQYMEDADAELKDAQEKGIDLPDPKPAAVEDEDVKEQLVDVKSDTEYDTFVDKLKQKTVNKIVADVSKIISDKKEEKGMTFDTKSTDEMGAMESTVSVALDYIQSKVFTEAGNVTDDQAEEVMGMAIREATLNQLDVAFGLPHTSFREYATRIRLGHGYIVTESAAAMIRGEA